ncbi:SOS response-associated peptidase [Nocardia sp. NBC_00881]|uniref:SOS response-associated peptidase family protein n=1 Tax=Nocardia sp. NBC_00881 TaxID=2975995 RepID=UPI00386F83C6|nr:SOS response-associated peptidase [Nocardia sp. NBC_00881]
MSSAVNGEITRSPAFLVEADRAGQVDAVERELPAFGEGATDRDELPPSRNIAPSQQARNVLERSDPDAEPVRQLRILIWDLVPSWAKELELG